MGLADRSSYRSAVHLLPKYNRAKPFPPAFCTDLQIRSILEASLRVGLTPTPTCPRGKVVCNKQMWLLGATKPAASTLP